MSEIVSFEKVIEHYGVKGMKWGVRKEEDSSAYRLQSAGTIVDPTLHRTTQEAALKVASLVGERYNFHVSEIRAIGPGTREYGTGAMGYVELNQARGTGGIIYSIKEDTRKAQKRSERAGWVAKDCGTPEAFLTHEAGHAIFHSEQKVKKGPNGYYVVGGHIKARDKALEVAIQEARKAGIPDHMFSRSVSGYAASSNTRMEVEAELFSQYHWSSKPPKFVTAWGETLHREMGIDPTPFRKKR